MMEVFILSTLKFKNGELVHISDLLTSLKLSGKASRGRSKLVKLLAKKEQEYNDDFNEIRKPHILLDDSGQPVIQDDKVQFKTKEDRVQVNIELEELSNEQAVIDITEYKEKLDALYQALDSYPYELERMDAMAYDTLMDQLEESMEAE